MRITSSAFRDEERIPGQYTRDGEDKSPPLRIEDVPVNARSLLLIMDDPDAPPRQLSGVSKDEVLRLFGLLATGDTAEIERLASS